MPCPSGQQQEEEVAVAAARLEWGGGIKRRPTHLGAWCDCIFHTALKLALPVGFSVKFCAAFNL